MLKKVLDGTEISGLLEQLLEAALDPHAERPFSPASAPANVSPAILALLGRVAALANEQQELLMERAVDGNQPIPAETVLIPRSLVLRVTNFLRKVGSRGFDSRGPQTNTLFRSLLTASRDRRELRDFRERVVAVPLAAFESVAQHLDALANGSFDAGTPANAALRAFSRVLGASPEILPVAGKTVGQVTVEIQRILRAERAQLDREVQEELDALDALTHANDLRNEEIERKLAHLGDAQRQLDAQLAEYRSGVTALEKRQHAATEQQHALVQREARVHEERQRLDADLASFAERQKKLGVEQHSVADRQRVIELREQRLASEKHTLEETRTALKAERDAVEEQRRALEERMSSVTQRERDVAEARAHLDTGLASLADQQRDVGELLQAEIETLEQLSEELGIREQALKGREVSIGEQQAQLNVERTALETERDAFDVQMRTLTEERASLEQQAISLADERRQLDGESAALQTERNAVDVRQHTLAEERASLEKQAISLADERRQLNGERAALETERSTVDEQLRAATELARVLDERAATLTADEERLSSERAAFTARVQAEVDALGALDVELSRREEEVRRGRAEIAEERRHHDQGRPSDSSTQVVVESTSASAAELRDRSTSLESQQSTRPGTRIHITLEDIPGISDEELGALSTIDDTLEVSRKLCNAVAKRLQQVATGAAPELRDTIEQFVKVLQGAAHVSTDGTKTVVRIPTAQARSGRTLLSRLEPSTRDRASSNLFAELRAALDVPLH
ncbi:MAG: hypothetical protein IT290_05900 [Deltaproteobacteria bacterium]|nr:hypothetical protein [Deltaproteobacteria bacterium]